MDFLDPKAKQRHKTRLIIGYILMGAVIFMTSSILVFSAYGFDVDRKTGEVIQNGLIFVDSAPDGAQVVLNNQMQRDKTNNRFSLPAGKYDMKIQKDQYRTWNRSFDLVGGEVERLMYPMLILNDLKPTELQALDAMPSFMTQSPDRRWVVLSQANSITSFNEYDLNTLNNQTDAPASRSFSVPDSLFTQAEGAHSLELVEWANDNKHFLVKHTFTGGFEFVVVSRDQPSTSININQSLKTSATTVTLRDKKFDQWYLYTQEGGVLQFADAKKEVTEVAKKVTAYKTHDSDTILYSSLNTDGTKQEVTLKQGNESNKIREVAAGNVALDIAKYDGNWQVVIGSDGDQKTYVYTDPVEILKSNDKSLAPATVMRMNGPLSWLSFSKNTRFAVVQSGQHFEVYDAEYKQTFRYNVDAPIDAGTKSDWIDGHRITVRSAGSGVIFDFDGSNKQTLLPTSAAAPLIFDRDYTVLYTFDASKTAAGKTAFNGTQLRLEEDK